MTTDKMRQLRSLSTLLDSQFKGPFGFRFGLDAILGLIPVAGDMVTAAMSFFIIAQATTLGASPSVLTRMSINVIFENIITLVPFLGNIFDFFWKSNNKNMRLLETHVADPRAATIQSRIFNILFLIVLLLILIACIVGGFFILKQAFEFISGFFNTATPSTLPTTGDYQ